MLKYLWRRKGCEGEREEREVEKVGRVGAVVGGGGECFPEQNRCISVCTFEINFHYIQG